MGFLATSRSVIAAVGSAARGLVTRAAVNVTQIPSAFMGYIREPYAGAWQEGASQQDGIGAITSFGAVYACISRIANDIAKLEPRLMSARPDGTTELAPSTSPFWRPLKRPNRFQNRIQFIIAWIVSKLMYGNTYVLKVREEARGMVREWYVLDPRRVTPMVAPDGTIYYSVAGDDLAQIGSQILPASEIIHDRGVTLWHPLMGVTPITACSASVTQGLRIQSNSSKFFANMSRPSGMLTAPGTIDDVTANRLKEEWEKNYSGLNIGRLAVLGDGLKYEPMTIPAEDAQLMEQLDWTVQDVARAFSVPLYKINAGPMPTAGNVEALESQYYSGCLQILIEAMELCMTEGMSAPEGTSVELNLDGLLRMDQQSQIEMLAKAVGGAIMKPDEARRARNLPPVAGGDTVYLQQQNYSLAALAKRDAREDPFATAKPPAPPKPPSGDGTPPADEAPDDETDAGDTNVPAASPAPAPKAIEALAPEIVSKAVADVMAPFIESLRPLLEKLTALPQREELVTEVRQQAEEAAQQVVEAERIEREAAAAAAEAQAEAQRAAEAAAEAERARAAETAEHAARIQAAEEARDAALAELAELRAAEQKRKDDAAAEAASKAALDALAAEEAEREAIEKRIKEADAARDAALAEAAELRARAEAAAEAERTARAAEEAAVKALREAQEAVAKTQAEQASADDELAKVLALMEAELRPAPESADVDA